MPETTINTSPLSPPAEFISTELASSSSLSQSPRATTLGSGSVTNQSDKPETSPGHLSHANKDASNHEIAGTFDRVKEIMSDNQLVINTFIAGGLAGATSRTVVSPLERLKIIL